MSDTISRQLVIDLVHLTILEFMDICADSEEEPMTEKNKLLLEVNKKICTRIKELPSAQPEYEPVKAEDFAKTMSENSLYNFVTWHQEALTLMKEQGFVICKKTM